jgi:hypothetical protein
MSWIAQNRSKDAKTPSAAGVMSRNPKLALCEVQRYRGRVPLCPSRVSSALLVKSSALPGQLGTRRARICYLQVLSAAPVAVPCLPGGAPPGLTVSLRRRRKCAYLAWFHLPPPPPPPLLPRCLAFPAPTASTFLFCCICSRCSCCYS